METRGTIGIVRRWLPVSVGVLVAVATVAVAATDRQPLVLSRTESTITVRTTGSAQACYDVAAEFCRAQGKSAYLINHREAPDTYEFHCLAPGNSSRFRLRPSRGP